jgi:hypothetical protein
MLMLASVTLVLDMCVSAGAGCTAGQPASRFSVTRARNLLNVIARGKEAGAGYQKAPQAAAAE